MSHRFDRHNPVGLRFLSLVEALDLRIVSNREVGRLDVGPGQILVAVLGIAFTFFLAVADLLTAHTPTVGSVVSYGRENVEGTLLTNWTN